MKNISIIGASGSIGTQTIEVIRNNRDLFNLVAFSVGYDDDYEFAKAIIDEFDIKCFCSINKSLADKISNEYSNLVTVYGDEGLNYIASVESDLFVNSVVGSVGLAPTVTAIKLGKDIALANKETLVVGGHIIMDLVKKHSVKLLPIDSEHSAIFQCLNGENVSEVASIILTASGGSFRNKSREELVDVSVSDALNHPNWSMGSKITIDSATMMNKGLEVIEAYYLFGVDISQIKVVIHYESLVHSMVEFNDNSIIAQIGTSDMYIPISYALSYPNRISYNSPKLDLMKLNGLTFKEIDFDRYPCVKYAYDAITIGHSMPIVLNASNEVAVNEFLNNRISFLQIEEVIKTMMDNHQLVENPSLEDIYVIDKEVREKTLEMIKWL